MAKSDDWRELAVQFRSIQDPQGLLHADWSCVHRVEDALPGTTSWQLLDGGDLPDHVRLDFEALAHRAGAEIDPTFYSPLIVWLESLRKERANLDVVRHWPEYAPDGSPAVHSSVSINGVCRVSADFCKVLEIRALEAERRSKTSGSAPVPAPQGGAAVSENKTVAKRFPGRAIWLDERLRERSWDHNDPSGFGGPDRKTVLRMLDGLSVSPDSLRKIVIALNRNKIGKSIGLLDVPNL